MPNYSDSIEVDSCSPNTEDTERYREPANPISKSQVSVRDPVFLEDAWGYRDVSSVKRTCCSHKAPTWRYTPAHNSSFGGSDAFFWTPPEPGTKGEHAYMQVNTLNRK